MKRIFFILIIFLISSAQGMESSTEYRYFLRITADINNSFSSHTREGAERIIKKYSQGPLPDPQVVTDVLSYCNACGYYIVMHRLLLLWEKAIDINLHSTKQEVSLACMIVNDYLRILNQEIFADILLNTQEEVIQLITSYTNIYVLLCERLADGIDINEPIDLHNNTYLLKIIKSSLEYSHTFAPQINGFLTHFIRKFRHRMDPYAHDYQQKNVFDLCTIKEGDMQERVKNKQFLAALLKKYFPDKLCFTKDKLDKLHNCHFRFIKQ